MLSDSPDYFTFTAVKLLYIDNFIGLLKGIRRIPIILLSLLLFCGCLRMGVPALPPNALLSVDTTEATPAYILLPENFQRQSLHDSSRLGHQYIFGLIPVTSLYLTTSVDSLIVELLVKVLVAKGYEPVLVPAKARKLLASSSAALILEPRLEAGSVNAFDLLFLRARGRRPHGKTAPIFIVCGQAACQLRNSSCGLPLPECCECPASLFSAGKSDPR